MTTLNAALNYSFASSESARIASAERGAEDSIATQIKLASANSPYQVGATITAKYQYKVGPDGSLVPQQTQITHTAPEDDVTTGYKGRRRASQQEEQRATLADLANPKIEMSPSDEVSIFAAAEAPAAAPVDVTPTTTQASAVQAEVLDENGESVDAEIITSATADVEVPHDKTSFMSLLAARAQTAAANLYARNSDIVYSTTPVTLAAA